MTTAQRTRRRMSGWARTFAAGAGAVVAVAGGAQGVQPEDRPIVQVQPAQQRGAEPVFVLERAALRDLFVDERDAGIVRAFSMFPARLRELAQESPEIGQIPEPVLRLMTTFASEPARVALTYNRADQSGGAFGLGAVVSMLAEGPEQARAVHGTVSGLVASQQLPFETRPSRAFEGMSEVFLPFGLLRWGPREVAGTWRYEVHVGSIGAEPERVFRVLPEGAPGQGEFRPVLRARLDPAPLTPLLDMARAFTGGQPEAEAALEQLVQTGLVGPDAIRYSFMYGYLPDRSVSEWRLEGARPYAERLFLATEPLREADFRLIPADATVASLMRFNAPAVARTLRQAAEENPQLAEGLAEFQRETGVDFVREILGSMGGTVAAYLSDTTGGAGLGSAVLVFTLSDTERFRQANAKLTTVLSVRIAEDRGTGGRVRGREWRDGGAEGTVFYSLAFPGLPAPVEPTYAVMDGALVFALTPQAAVAAVRQARGDGRGLLANEGVRASLPQGGSFTSLTYIDTARTMRGGYQYVALAGSAIANAMRSPSDPAREPGLVVPPFTELARNVRPRVGFGYWEGDTLVFRTYGNRSVLVDAAGLIGAAEPVLPLVGAAAFTGFQHEQQQRMERRRDRRGRN